MSVVGSFFTPANSFQSFLCFQRHSKHYLGVQAKFLWRRPFISRKGDLEYAAKFQDFLLYKCRKSNFSKPSGTEIIVLDRPQLKGPRMPFLPAGGDVLRGAGAGSQMICLTVTGAQGANQVTPTLWFQGERKANQAQTRIGETMFWLPQRLF